MKPAREVALVTGAASGIGRAMVDGFLRAGRAVVAADVSAPGLAALEGPRVTTVVADVGVRADVDRMIDRALSAHNRLDILCNNAGIPDRFEGVTECEDEEWERVLAVNLSGAFFACRRAVQIMLERSGGVILNTASVAAFRGGEAGVAYTVAKHGLVGLTRSIAAMYADDGIRCVAICPGPVTTGITRLNAQRRQAGELSARGQETARKTAALRSRWLEPRQVADLAVFVCSESGTSLNGCSIPADSGRMVF